MFKFRVAVLAFAMTFLTASFWWASDPHSFWILWVTIPVFLALLFVEIQRKRGKAI